MLVDFRSIEHDYYGQVERPVLSVKTPDGRIISTISNYFDLKIIFRFNDVSEVNFNIPSSVYGELNNGYQEVSGMRMIEIEPFGDFILVNPEKTNEGGIKEIMSCTAYSKEYAFNYKKAEIPAGTYNFYNPIDNKDTILTMITEFMPDWSIGTVDKDLIGRWRTFDNVDDNLYAFMMNTLEESYNCLFLFDTFNKKINVKSADSVVDNLPIYLSYNNLLKSTKITELSDEVITALSGYGSGDEVNIRTVNPNGTNTIYNLDYFISKGDLPEDLTAKWIEYRDNNLKLYTDIFSNLSVLFNEKINERYLADAKKSVIKTDYDALNTAYLTAQTQKEQSEEYDKEIADLKEKLDKKKKELDAQQQYVDLLIKDIETIDKQLNDIVNKCKITSFFTKDEVKILTQYFKQDSIVEDTFVIPEYKSAILESNSNVLDVNNKGTIKVVGSQIYATNLVEIFEADENGFYKPFEIDPESGEKILNGKELEIFEGIEVPEDIANTVADQLNEEQKRKVYEFRGGTFEFTQTIQETINGITKPKDIVLKGDVVSVDFHYNTDNTLAYIDENSPDITKEGFFTVTAVLRNAIYNEISYPSMNVSLEGVILKSTPQIGENFMTLNIDHGVFYNTASTTEYQKQAVIQELYDFTKTTLEKISVPSYEFSVESGNFLFAQEFEPFKNELRLGSTVNLALDDKEENIIQPILIELEVNYDDASSFNITFSNKYHSSESRFQLADIIKETTRSSHSVSLNKASYSSYKDSQAGNQVDKLTNSNLDVARNAIINSVNQGMEWNSSGMFLRKTLPNGHYDNEQVGLINNQIAFTDDNWDSVKLALGHFSDPNLGDTWGIVAPNITGTLLAGENLVIENTILDESGQKIVKQFKVDGSGAWLNNASLALTKEPNLPAGYQGGKILIDPELGIAMGNIEMFTLDGTNIKPTFKDEEGKIIWDEDKKVETEDGSIYYVPKNTKFFFDIDSGNAYFGGTISGENIVANTINGKSLMDMTVDAGSKLTGDVNTDQIYKNVIESINKYIKMSEETGKPVVSIGNAVIKDLSADNFVGNTITANTVETDGLKTNVIDAINAYIGDAKISSAKIDKIEVNHLTGNLIEAINATIGNAKIDKAKIGTLDADQVNITNGYIKDAMIESLSAGKIVSGDISADRIQANIIEAINAYIGNLVIDKSKIGVLDADQVNITNGYIKDAMIDSLSAGKIKTGSISAEVMKTNVIEAVNAYIGEAVIDKSKIGILDADQVNITKGYIKDAMIDSLSAGKITTGSIVSGVMKANVIEAINAYVGEAVINSAKIGNLSADKITSGTLDASKATITNINADNINTGTLKSDYMQISDGFIKNAMIESISTNKILSGSIYTNKISVQSEDGGLKIVGNTAQWSDKNGKIRMQAGRDASDNFTFAVFGEDGRTAYFDETGIKAAGVPSNIIVNDMVSDSANISAGKLDISSLFDTINNDGSHTINTNKIFFDDKKQSLEVYLASVETKADNALSSAGSNSEDLNKFKQSIDESLKDMQGQIDGSIMTWFYQYEPNNTNEPAVSWNTVDLKNNHLGDLFYNTITGYCYRWQVKNNQYSWQKLSDSDITKALENAKAAHDLADNKRRVFTGETSPTPPYDKGDVWMQGKDGDIYICDIAKNKDQSYAAIDWKIASKYTDDTIANTAITKINVEQGRINTLVEKTTNINGTLQTVKSQAEQTAEGFSWLVKSGDNINNFVITDQLVSSLSKSTLLDEITGKVEANSSAISQNSTNISSTVSRVSTVEGSVKEANTKADDAVSKAASAVTKADGAISDANTAKQDATKAKEDAASAITNSNSAIGTANTAKQDATNAVNKADEAHGIATNAQKDADSAVDSANTANTKVDNLQIGGRNYVEHSKNPIAYNQSHEHPTELGYYEFNSYDIGRAVENLEDGEIITISFDIDIICEEGSKWINIYNSNYPGEMNVGYSRVTFNATPIIDGHFKGRIICNTNITKNKEISTSFKGKNYIEFYTGYDTNRHFKISNLKLEKGNKATDWTLAPEDVDSSITDAQNAADQAQTDATTANETIKGAVKKITTYYALSSSKTEYIEASKYPWNTIPYPHIEGYFMWSKTITSYMDSSLSDTITGPVCLAGAKGEQGDKGDVGSGGLDAITINISSTGGTIFKEQSINTVLVADVYQGGKKLDETAINKLGTLKWYSNNDYSKEIGTGVRLTVQNINVKNNITYSVRLIEK